MADDASNGLPLQDGDYRPVTLWRTIKYEHVYKHVYASVADARRLIAGHIDWYNAERPHSSLQDQTPNEAYCASLPKSAKAA